MEGESMNWDIELAKEFKQRDNQEVEGAVLGTVITNEPLTISIYNNKVILNGENCYICSNLISNTKAADIVIDNVTSNGQITFKDILKPNDKVLCLPTANGQKFFIIDRVVG
jgi:hypothetical protein